MPYFSRLTDIVTCNLSSLLASSDHPQQALEEILQEMNEGIAGAERSVRTACQNVIRIESEIGEQRSQSISWTARAEDALRNADELQARSALERRYELEDLIAGLEQQLQAAIATRDHLQTMLQALQARAADARRRLEELVAGTASPASPAVSHSVATVRPTERHSRIELELAELRRRLHTGE